MELKDKTIEQLKAMVYDLSVEMQRIQNSIQIVTQEIQKQELEKQSK